MVLDPLGALDLRRHQTAHHRRVRL
jgi:ActR/RegA family two-component response regulator